MIQYEPRDFMDSVSAVTSAFYPPPPASPRNTHVPPSNSTKPSPTVRPIMIRLSHPPSSPPPLLYLLLSSFLPPLIRSSVLLCLPPFFTPLLPLISSTSRLFWSGVFFFFFSLSPSSRPPFSHITVISLRVSHSLHLHPSFVPPPLPCHLFVSAFYPTSRNVQPPKQIRSPDPALPAQRELQL